MPLSIPLFTTISTIPINGIKTYELMTHIQTFQTPFWTPFELRTLINQTCIPDQIGIPILTEIILFFCFRGVFDEFVRDVIIEDRVLIKIEAVRSSFSFTPAILRMVSVTTNDLVNYHQSSLLGSHHAMTCHPPC